MGGHGDEDASRTCSSPPGPTQTTIGTGLAKRRRPSRVACNSPPGVSRTITSASARCSFAFWIPCKTYSLELWVMPPSSSSRRMEPRASSLAGKALSVAAQLALFFRASSAPASICALSASGLSSMVLFAGVALGFWGVACPGIGKANEDLARPKMRSINQRAMISPYGRSTKNFRFG